jgi:2Fe-2S ferredoxin
MAKIIITNRDGEKSEIEGEVGISLMENLRDNDYELEAICGGQCSCATCHVYIDDNWVSRTGKRSDEENELLEELECMKEGSRLSCQVPFTAELDGLEVTIAEDE